MHFARRARGRCRLVVASVLLLLCGPLDSPRAATGLPPGFQDVPVVSGLSSPTAMEFAPDGRLFVTQQGGQLRVIKNGVLLPDPFLTLNVNSLGERGLLGITFDPNFAINQFVYVYYTVATPPIHNRISRFTANGDVMDASVPEVVLLDFDNLSDATNHNGGALHFGPDDKLYAAHGENANGANSQTLNNLLGKVIRMNPVPGATAQVPTDNPFFGMASGKNRLIWALGLRNPFTFSFQPGTGRAFVNDVGASTWEEINDASAGRNFGWPATEGRFDQATFPAFTNPLYAYQHSAGTPRGCAITGGAFYNPSTPTFPASYVGKYFFSDVCSGWIYYIDPNSPATATQFAASIPGPVDLKVGPDGALYYLAINSGTVGKIVVPGAPQTTRDFSGDGRADIAVFRPSTGVWYLRNISTITWGGEGDIPVAGDYDGDGKSDIAVFRPSTGVWYIRAISTITWGGSGDIPVVGDYNADGRADIAVFRPSTGVWWVRGISTTTWGGVGDIPVVGDYNGDRRADIAVFRPSTGVWYVRGISTTTWGGVGDIPVVGDYDGDGKSDIAVFRPSTGVWYVRGITTVTYGGQGDIPVPGDYNADGKTDIAIFRPSTGAWFVTTLGATTTWGGGGDIPILQRP